MSTTSLIIFFLATALSSASRLDLTRERPRQESRRDYHDSVFFTNGRGGEECETNTRCNLDSSDEEQIERKDEVVVVRASRDFCKVLRSIGRFCSPDTDAVCRDFLRHRRMISLANEGNGHQIGNGFAKNGLVKLIKKKVDVTAPVIMPKDEDVEAAQGTVGEIQEFYYVPNKLYRHGPVIEANVLFPSGNLKVRLADLEKVASNSCFSAVEFSVVRTGFGPAKSEECKCPEGHLISATTSSSASGISLCSLPNVRVFTASAYEGKGCRCTKKAE